MSVTFEDLKAICRVSNERRLELFVEPLNKAMDEFEIDTPKRQAAFIAQIAHESGGFHYVREIASGEAYEGRADLGNTEEGDGRRFRGRGLVQITGRDNYRRCGDALGIDLLGSPELLEGAELAARSAAWFWSSHGLNELADKGDFKKVTKVINGGFTHFAERLALWNRAKEVLGG